MLRGIGGDVGGQLLGAAAGVGLGAAVSAMSKGKIDLEDAMGAGLYAGALPGALLGGHLATKGIGKKASFQDTIVKLAAEGRVRTLEDWRH